MSHSEDLLTLQDLDCRIRDARRELADIPARQQAEQQRLAEHRQQVEEAEADLKSRQADIKQLELESMAGKERIAKFRQQQLQLKTNKEFKTMESEIETVKKEISEIEDRELGLMELVEGARGALQEKQAALATEDKAVQEDVGVLAERAARIAEEAKRLEEERATVAVLIETKWLTRYESVMTRRDLALVRLDDGICGGCHMRLPPSVAHDTRKSPGKTSCPYCGRLLY